MSVVTDSTTAMWK